MLFLFLKRKQDFIIWTECLYQFILCVYVLFDIVIKNIIESMKYKIYKLF